MNTEFKIMQNYSLNLKENKEFHRLTKTERIYC